MWTRDRYLAPIQKLKPDIRLLSLDIFDTILFRTYHQPVDLFYEVGKRAVAARYTRSGLTAREFQEVRILAEKQARSSAKKLNGCEEVTLAHIYRQIPERTGNRTALMALELQCERESCFINPNVTSLIEEMRAEGCRIALLSDMYLSSSEILKMLEAAQFPTEWIDVLLISCEHNGGKSDGSLFQLLLEKFPDISPDAILHIGDNKGADVEGAAAKGIRAVHYQVIPVDFESFFEWENIRHGPTLAELHSLRKVAVSASAPYNPKDRFWFEFGAGVMGPFLTLFCDWIIDVCLKEKRNSVYPLMREGYLLAPLLRNAADHRGADLYIKPLYVSRQATFLAGIKDFTQEDFGNLFERNHFTVNDLLRMFELSSGTYAKFGEVELTECQNIDLPDGSNLKESLMEFLLIPSTQDHINDLIEQQRSLLITYLKQTCLSLDNAVTVDLGFKGTIQKSIESALSLSEIQHEWTHILAFGGIETRTLLAKGMDIRGFVGNAGEHQDIVKVIMRSPEVWEELLMGDFGSTKGYSYLESGQVMPLLAEAPYTDEEINRKELCHCGVRTFQEYWYSFVDSKPHIRENLYSRTRELGLLLHRVLDMPTYEEAQLLGDLTHDDNFGSTHAQQICNKVDEQWLQELGTEHFLEQSRFGYKAIPVYWPQAIVTRNDAAYLFKKFVRHNDSFSYLAVMNEMVSQLRNDGHQRILIYGAGVAGQSLLKVARLYQLEIAGFVDRKSSLWGEWLDGVEILSLEQAMQRNVDTYAIGSLSFVKEIRKTIGEAYRGHHKRPLIYVPYTAN